VEHGQELIQQMQSQLHEQWKRVRETLVEQRREVDTARQSLLQLRDEFRSERDELTNWVSQREYQLKAIEEALVRERALSVESENRWTASRDRWRAEKIEAESVIRGLLLQLEIMSSGPPTAVIPIAPQQIARELNEDDQISREELGRLISAA
jgi:hypothetical protein